MRPVAVRKGGGKSGLRRVEDPPVKGGGHGANPCDGKCHRKQTARKGDGEKAG